MIQARKNKHQAITSISPTTFATFLITLVIIVRIIDIHLTYTV